MKELCFKTNRGRMAYRIAKGFYIGILCAYLPLIALITYLEDILSPGGFMDLGFWFPFLVSVLVTLPFALMVALGGLLIRHLIRVRLEGSRVSKRGKWYGLCALLFGILFFILLGTWVGGVTLDLLFGAMTLLSLGLAILFTVLMIKSEQENQKC